MPRALAAELKTAGRGAINPAAIRHATPASTTSVHPEVTPTTVHAQGCTIPHRTMIIPHRTITATTATTRTSIPTTSAATATATTPDRFPGCKTKTAARNRAAVLFQIAKDQITTTFAPTLTRPYRSITSSLRIRMQPDETLVPIVHGSLEPWMR